jgi:hypothetical protein
MGARTKGKRMVAAEIEDGLFPQLDEIAALGSEALGEPISRSQVVRACLHLGLRNAEDALRALVDLRIEDARAKMEAAQERLTAKQVRLEAQRARLELIQNQKPRPSDLGRGSSESLRRRRDSQT